MNGSHWLRLNQHRQSQPLHLKNQLNLDHTFKSFSVGHNDVDNIVNKLRVKDLDGISITSPYKRDFINYIDDIDPLANRIGSINCIASTSKKLIGHNTDYYGFQCMLENNNLILDNKKIVVFLRKYTAIKKTPLRTNIKCN